MTFFLRAFWSLQRVMFKLVYSIWRISELPQPIISIFGGSRLAQDDYYAQQARTLAHQLVDNNISVLTGGGPGIMEAANCGALCPNKGTGGNVGIGIRGLQEPRNTCVQYYIQFDQFFVRKWFLTRYSCGFIFFPGGFGTLDEFAEILTLMQTNFLKKVPIILIGKEYWNPLVEWLTHEGLQHGLIGHMEFTLFTLTDDVETAFNIIRAHCGGKDH